MLADLALILGALGVWISGDRELDCRGLATARAAEICQSLSRNMEFDWLGHAIISPGFKVTFETTRRTYCELKITEADVVALKELLEAQDWRVQNGADFLLRLSTGHSRYGDAEDEASIFNPNNASFLLKDGCGA